MHTFIFTNDEPSPAGRAFPTVMCFAVEDGIYRHVAYLDAEKRASGAVEKLKNGALPCHAFSWFSYRAEHHEVLAEYKKGVGSFIGKDYLNYMHV